MANDAPAIVVNPRTAAMRPITRNMSAPLSMVSSASATSKKYADEQGFRELFSRAVFGKRFPEPVCGGGVLAYATAEVSAMPQKTNEWDPNAKAATPSPQRDDEEREMADDEEDLDEDDEFEDSDEGEEDGEVEEE
jgi:hypothetical protein